MMQRWVFHELLAMCKLKAVRRARLLAPRRSSGIVNRAQAWLANAEDRMLGHQSHLSVNMQHQLR